MLKSIVTALIFFLAINLAQSQSIITSTVAGSPFCAGASLNVNFTVIAGPFAAGNVFTAQLSNAAGSFASPVVLGTLTSTTAAPIACVIPLNQPAGAGYKVRVVGSAPAVTGSNSISTLTIKAFGMNAPTLAAGPFCAGSTFNVTNSFLSTCTYTAGNIFTVELSDGTGSFASPTPIGTSAATTAGSISVTLPSATPTFSQYRVRISSTNPVTTSPDNGTDFTINAVALSAPTFAGTSFCAGSTFSVTNTLASVCNFSAGNTFSVQLSDASGSFAAPTTIGTSVATAGGAISVTIPATEASGTGYRIRVVGSNPTVTGPDNGANLNIDQLGISSISFAGTNFCGGATFSLTYALNASCPFSAGNVFTAQLSDASGSFASPTTVGTVTATAAGAIAVTIPAAVTAGTLYRIRVISSAPATTSADNGTNLTLNPTTLNAPTFAGTTFCASNSFTLNYSGGCAPQAGNVYTAQLSSATGSFAAPTSIGTLTSSVSSGSFTVTIPTATATGTGYRIRVTTSLPALTSADNGTDLTINALTISAPTFAGTTFCQSQALTINFVVPGGCNFPNTPSANIFTAQLSSAAGSFAAPTTIGTVTASGSGTIAATIPAAAAAGVGYRIRVISSNPGAGLISPDNGTNLTINTLALTAPTFTGTSFCQFQSFTINYTLASGCAVPDIPALNVFTAQLSDATGSFAAPTAIGTVTANSAGTITATIPGAQAAGAAYRIRVISSNPGAGLTSPNSVAVTINVLSINAPTLSAGPTFCQGQAFNVNFVVPNACGLPNTPSANVFTAQLSDATGSFASPVAIGTLTSSTSGAIPSVIPVTTAGGSAYKIRVVSSNPGAGLISPTNAASLTVNTIGLNAPTFVGTAFCQGQTFNVAYTFTSTCPFLTGNVFTAQLSDQFGNFSAPVAIGTSAVTTAGNISVTIASTTIAGNAYKIRVVGSVPNVISPDNGTNLSIKALGIAAPTTTQTSFCQGNSFTVSFLILNACGFPNTPSANIFTAQLSDASGSFAAPTNIGSVTSNTSNNITATIPVAQTPGAGYRIRIVSSNPGTGMISPDNGTNISVAATSGNPATFGAGVWNAYVYNAASLTNYSGFYTENNLSFNTTTRFPAANAPSTADASTGAAYTGCAVATSPWTISFKRTNFACGYYQIDLPAHDDNVTVFVNGVQVYTIGCCTANLTNVWSGFLGASNTIEIQLVNTGGPGNLAVTMSTSATPITTSPPVTVCAGTPTTLSASSTVPLTFNWSPAGSLSATTGNSVVATPAVTTTYSVVGQDASSLCFTPPSTILVTVATTFNLTLTNTTPSICSGISTSTLSVSGANSYTWSPAAGLSATTGNSVTANPASTTLYTVQGSIGACTPPKNATTTVTVGVIPTSPPANTPGTNVWNVYAYNDQTESQLYGFYTENNMSFNTTTRWSASVGPWAANASSGSAYTGCIGNSTSWSAAFVRTGFPCGYYQIDVPYHDDNITLVVNGVTVFQHNGCCDLHTNVYTGFLGANSTVAWHLVNGAGPGSLQTTIAPSATSPLMVNPSIVVCSGQVANLNSSTTIPGVTYQWTRNSDGTSTGITNSTSANATAGPLTTSDVYTVTITDAANTLTCTAFASIPVTVNPNPNTIVTPNTGLSSYCPGTAYTLTASGANTYSWSSQPGLNVYDQYQVIASPLVTTTYTVTGSTGTSCGSNTASVTITVNPVVADGTAGVGTWNNFAFNSTTVGTNYAGYYTDNGNGASGYDFDSRTRWASGAAPSTANATNGQAYLGCTMPAVNISLRFKRTNFVCGLYQLNVNFHDDAFTLSINGVQVAQHNGCCDVHTAIWTGMLNPNSVVEWQLVQGSGGSGLAVQFVPQTLPAGTSIWIGSVSNDWFNAANWCSAVPTSTIDAIIPAGATNFPTIAAAGANVRSITSSAPVAAGTFNNALPGAALTISGTNNLNVFGSWANGGTFTANSSTVTFTGANSGNTIGNTFPATFNNLVINKTNGITNNLGLLQVAGLLTFTTGIFTDLTAINILSGANYTGASNSSYVDGPITKTGNVAFSFPVGKGGLLRPIAISAPALATDNFTAQYFNSNPNPTYPNALRPATVDHVSGAEYWYLNRSGGSDNVFVTPSWDTNSGGVGQLSSLRVVRWDVALNKWIDEGNGGTTGNTTAGTITTAAAVTTFSSPNSPFSLGSTSLLNTLPVELTDFVCSLESPGNVRIAWTTQSELHNARFDVERSSDGSKFSSILSVPGNGTTSEIHHYATNDLNAPAGTLYYRLRQIDVNGVSSVSEIESVDNPYSNSVSVYPNPAGDSFSVNLEGRTLYQFSMIDLMEKVMSVPYFISDDKLTVTTASLASGVYIVQLVLDGKQYRVKLVRK